MCIITRGAWLSYFPGFRILHGGGVRGARCLHLLAMETVADSSDVRVLPKTLPRVQRRAQHGKLLTKHSIQCGKTSSQHQHCNMKKLLANTNTATWKHTSRVQHLTQQETQHFFAMPNTKWKLINLMQHRMQKWQNCNVMQPGSTAT